MEGIGSRIRYAREVAGIGQRALADACEMSVEWLRRVEGGRPAAIVRDRHLPVLAETLGVVPEWLLGGRQDGGPVKRRDFVRNAGIVGAGLAAAGAAGLIPGRDLSNSEPWARLEAVLDRRVGPDAATVEHLGDITVALEALQYEKAPGALVGATRGHLSEIVQMLQDGNLPAALRRELLSLAGETAATLGWLRWDLDEPDAASYWSAGRRAALEAGDRPLADFIQASTSWLPEHRDDQRKRIEILAGSKAGVTPRSLVWVLMSEAECSALEGAEAPTLRLLDQADAVMVRLGDDRTTRRPRCDTWDATRSLGERGAVLVRLATHQSGRFRARGREAEELLSNAIREMDAQPSLQRMSLSLRVSLARTRVQLGQVDGAIQAATEALDGATAMGIRTIPERLRAPGKLLAELRPWSSDPAVRRFRERLIA